MTSARVGLARNGRSSRASRTEHGQAPLLVGRLLNYVAQLTESGTSRSASTGGTSIDLGLIHAPVKAGMGWRQQRPVSRRADDRYGNGRSRQDPMLALQRPPVTRAFVAMGQCAEWSGKCFTRLSRMHWPEPHRLLMSGGGRVGGGVGLDRCVEQPMLSRESTTGAASGRRVFIALLSASLDPA
jgi:hypothetical protein